MTNVELIYDNNINIGFKMKGHAGFNLVGPDILCASLSTASQMTVNGLLDWTGLSIDDVVVENNQASGMLHIVFPGDLVSSPTTQQLFKAFEMYIEQLCEQYNDYVKMERRQKNDNEN